MLFFRLFSFLVFSSMLVSCAGIGPRTPTPEPVTLHFSYIGEKEDYKALVDQFHASNPQITIEANPISGDQFQTGYNALRAQFQEADVLRANYSYLSPEQIAAVRPLDDFLVAEKSINRADVFPGLMEAMKYQGAQLGLPAGINPLVMFYENSFFKIANATPPASNYTLDEFLAAAQLVNHHENADKAAGKFSYGICTSPINMDPLVFTELFGGNIFNDEAKPTQPTLNDPANVEAVNWYASLWSDYQLPPPVTKGGFGAYPFVYQNQCGFWIQVFDMSGFMRGRGIDQRMLPLPKGKAPVNDSTWDAYFLTKKSAHPAEAWKWMSFLMQNQAASSVQIPPLLSQIASEDYAKRVSPDALGIARGLKDGLRFAQISDLNTPWKDSIRGVYLESVRQVVVGDADTLSALNDAQRQAEAIFADQK